MRGRRFGGGKGGKSVGEEEGGSLRVGNRKRGKKMWSQMRSRSRKSVGEYRRKSKKLCD